MGDTAVSQLPMHESPIEANEQRVKVDDSSAVSEEPSANDPTGAEGAENDAEEEAEEEEEEDDDELDEMGLTKEQAALLRERQAQLQREYAEYTRAQTESKINDIVSRATSFSRSEAEAALNLTDNNEVEALHKLLNDTSFAEKVRDMIRQQQEDEERRREIAANGGRRLSARISARPPRESSSEEKRKRSGKPAEGFNVDGTKRAPTIHLEDALRRLQEIEKSKQLAQQQKLLQQQQEQVDLNAASSPSKSTKRASALSSPVAKSPKVAEAAKDSATSQSQALTSNSSAAEVVAPVDTSSGPKNEDDYTEEDLRSLEWSDARIRAFLGRKENPNAYYYRFNAPGEAQRTGGWSPEEHKSFMELIKDGVDYRWGLFSIKLPGRVGYQCSNYYRKLVSDGTIVDPNYTVDESGKLAFIRPRAEDTRVAADGVDSAETTPNKKTKLTINLPEGGGVLPEGESGALVVTPAVPGAREGEGAPAVKRARVSSAPVVANTTTTVIRKKKKKSKKRSAASLKRRRNTDVIYADSDDSESESEDEVDPEEEAKFVNLTKDQLVLPEMNDPMTFRPMLDPCISPFGHVMDYSTWLKLLKIEPINTCPFTKQRVTRRSLVHLTKSNIDDHRSRIVGAEKV